MSDYKAVTEALEKGVEPSLLCSTCPWDRFCITPPTMTSSQVNEQIEKARVKDEGHQKENADKFPMAEILTTLMVGGMDRRAEICPVFSLRLRSSEGINIVMSMKNTMKSWDDNSIGKAVML